MFKKILIMVLAVTMLGCTHIIVRKAFKPASADLKGDAKIAFSVRPSAKEKSPDVTIYGEPYQLLAFVDYQNDDRTVAFSDVTLKGVNGVSLTLPDKDRNLRLDDSHSPEGTTVFEYEINNIEYQPYTLSGELTFEKDADSISYPLEVTLDTDYEEKKVNRIWEGLMGI